MKRPICYQLIGVPGSGKSTWVAQQEWADNCAYVSTDLHVENQANNDGKTYSEVFADFMPFAVKMMEDDVKKAREAGKDIIWDQTSTTVNSRKRKFKMLPNYKHIAVVFKTPERNELYRRLNSRQGKTIPDEIIKSMVANFQMPSKAEGFDEIWYV